MTGQFLPADSVLSLNGRSSRKADQPAKLAVGPTVRRENDELEVLPGRDFTADDELQRQVPRCRMGTHDAGDGTFVGQSESRIAKLGGQLDQLLRMRRPAQKRKVAETMQLCVFHRRHDRRQGG